MKVTMADVARAAGVSPSLVSLAFQDAYGVSRSTRDRILSTAQRMGYLPNQNGITSGEQDGFWMVLSARQPFLRTTTGLLDYE